MKRGGGDCLRVLPLRGERMGEREGKWRGLTEQRRAVHESGDGRVQLDTGLPLSKAHEEHSADGG